MKESCESTSTDFCSYPVMFLLKTFLLKLFTFIYLFPHFHSAFCTPLK